MLSRCFPGSGIAVLIAYDLQLLLRFLWFRMTINSTVLVRFSCLLLILIIPHSHSYCLGCGSARSPSPPSTLPPHKQQKMEWPTEERGRERITDPTTRKWRLRWTLKLISPSPLSRPQRSISPPNHTSPKKTASRSGNTDNFLLSTDGIYHCRPLQYQPQVNYTTASQREWPTHLHQISAHRKPQVWKCGTQNL
jgi:hypothetical protein